MPKFNVGKTKTAKPVRPKLRKPLPYLRGAAEEERERVKIRKTSGGEPSPQSAPTTAADVTGPGGDQREIVFDTYTPLSKPRNLGLFGLAPPDMSGADSPLSIVLYTGNTYLAA